MLSRRNPKCRENPTIASHFASASHFRGLVDFLHFQTAVGYFGQTNDLMVENVGKIWLACKIGSHTWESAVWAAWWTHAGISPLRPRLISVLFSNIRPRRSIHLMLLLILAYLPNVGPDVSQMSQSTIGWSGNFAEYSILLITCWSKLGHWIKG